MVLKGSITGTLNYCNMLTNYPTEFQGQQTVFVSVSTKTKICGISVFCYPCKLQYWGIGITYKIKL